MALLLFQYNAKGILGVFLWKISDFWLVFWICHPYLLFDFLADFSFCWIFLPKHFGLVLRLNTNFWHVFPIYLLVFCKITWHHCCKEVRERSILLIWSRNVKIWCYLMLKRQQSDVNETGPSGNNDCIYLSFSRYTKCWVSPCCCASGKRILISPNLVVTSLSQWLWVSDYSANKCCWTPTDLQITNCCGLRRRLYQTSSMATTTSVPQGRNHLQLIISRGQNGCNLMLYWTIKHVFENFGVAIAGLTPGCGLLD